MTFVGCDLHTRKQPVAVLDTRTGEVSEHQLVHDGRAIEEFYAALPRPVTIGIESTGYAVWFHTLMQHLEHTLLVGDAATIRAMVVRKTKTDRRDARHLLDLIVRAVSGGRGAGVGVPRTAVPSTGPLYRLCSVTRARIVAGAMWRFHEATHASKPSASDASKWVESRSTCASSGKRGTVSA